VKARPRETRHYQTENDSVPSREWLDKVEQTDKEAYGVILQRIDRVERGAFGDCKHLGGGVWELKIDYGPGYRIYFGEDGDLVILLHGAPKGTKGKQNRDIRLAKERWRDYNA
jgi:putative addiction module killer protein